MNTKDSSVGAGGEEWTPGVYSEQFPPGTIPLEKLFDKKHGEIILHPRPTTDPNDPLNWSKWYKAWNFALVSYYTLMIFVNLDIGTVIWGQTQEELGYTIQQNTWGFGFNTAGLAVGCVLFIPFALKFGRRIVYLFSIAVSLATAIWQARMYTAGDLFGANILSGLAGSIAETICQMTIADLFFVHQRGTANGIYIVMVNIGAFLAPVAAGYSANSQGWRWIFWWTTILFAVNLILYTFAYEDTKYVPSQHGTSAIAVERTIEQPKHDSDVLPEDRKLSFGADDQQRLARLDSTIPRKSYVQRMTILSTSPGGWRKFACHLYQPFWIMFTFPAIAWTALTYGSLLAWFSVCVSAYSVYFTLPPYNFSSAGIGLLNLAPFIGGLFGSVFGGLLSDWLIIRLSRRNNGIYEPEMRLWLTIPNIFILPAGMLMFGLPMAKGMPWIISAVGCGIFGFAFAALGDIALTYAMDCYKEVIGDALIAVCFVRNAFATIIALCLTDWISGMGLDGVFALSAALAFILSATSIPLLIWGKRFRIQVWRSGLFEKMKQRQFGVRE